MRRIGHNLGRAEVLDVFSKDGGGIPARLEPDYIGFGRGLVVGLLLSWRRYDVFKVGAWHPLAAALHLVAGRYPHRGPAIHANIVEPCSPRRMVCVGCVDGGA